MATESRIETEADSLGERGLANGESRCRKREKGKGVLLRFVACEEWFNWFFFY